MVFVNLISEYLLNGEYFSLALCFSLMQDLFFLILRMGGKSLLEEDKNLLRASAISMATPLYPVLYVCKNDIDKKAYDINP
jgi:hypothetical protein